MIKLTTGYNHKCSASIQRKHDKLEMSKLLYFIHLVLMKNGIGYFFDCCNRSEVIASEYERK